MQTLSNDGGIQAIMHSLSCLCCPILSCTGFACLCLLYKPFACMQAAIGQLGKTCNLRVAAADVREPAKCTAKHE